MDFEMFVDFSRHPEMDLRRLAPNELVEPSIVRRYKEVKPWYIMLSSRSVYGKSKELKTYSEDSPVFEDSYSAVNNLEKERLIHLMCEDRCTILRLSNIFGFESDPSRKTFFTWLFLQAKNYGRISTTIAGTTRRDFLPVNAFSKTLDSIITRPVSGTFNIGSGMALPIMDVVERYANGFGITAVEAPDATSGEQHELDVTKLRKHWGQSVTLGEIFDAAEVAGTRGRLEVSEIHKL